MGKCKHFLYGVIAVLLLLTLSLSACARPTATPPTTTPPTTTPPTTLVDRIPSDITSNRPAYDGKSIEVTGQAYLASSPPKLLVDGISGINLGGNIDTLGNGFYRLTGVYNAATNTLNVTQSIKEQVKYLAIEAGKQLGFKFVPVSVQGLVATVPKEVSDKINYYISIPLLSSNTSIYPYAIFTEDALYLALSSNSVEMPTKVTFGSGGLTLSGGEVKGTLVKTPLENIVFGPNWSFGEFGGVIIAETIASLSPISATVHEINSNPDSYIFKRVSIDGSYIVATATINPYSEEMRVPIGLGVLLDEFPDLFQDSPQDVIKNTLLTLNPESKVWQLRRGEVIGTVIYPTKDIRKYLDYLPAGGPSPLKKPALIVDDMPTGQVVTANVEQLNPIYGHPSQYWDKVVEFEGYALGIRYSLGDIISPEAKSPIDVTLTAVGITTEPIPPFPLPPRPPDLIIVGLDNDLSNVGEPILGKYKFTVAVTQMPEPIIDLPLGLSELEIVNTAFFLLKKELISMELPPISPPVLPPPPPTIDIGDLQITPTGASVVEFGRPMLPWEGPPLPIYVDVSIRLQAENPTDVDISISNIEYQVHINSKYAGHGSVAGIYTVPPKGDYQIDSIFRADFATTGEIVITAIVSGRFNIEITGTAHLEGNSQTKDIQFSYVIQLP